ncbi:MAG: protein kinase, partial [Gammaproteobacteria bacterium]|nr:protein kinase [Gammaproteobacteria bacterium]
MPFESDQEKSEIEIKKINSLPTRKIPYIPNIVKEDNLQPDTFKLLSEEAIKKIKAQNLPAGKYKKNMKIADADLEGVPVSVLVTEDLETKEKRYFAFNPGAPLGGGGYGKVRLGQDLDTGKWFAIKLQKESKVAKKEHEIITKMESNLTSPVRKKHLKDKEGKRELEESKQRIMVMEYVPGMSLQEFRFLKKNDKNSESVYINVAEAAIAALNELFKKGILHRDIKLANLMFNILTEKVNVIDLGLALQGELGTPKKEGLAEGTPAYMAPELFNKWLSGDETKVTYNEATEVFALGKALAELLRLTVSDPYPDKLQDVNGKEIKEVPDRREYLNKTRMLRILTPDEFNNSSSITDEKTRAQIQNPVIKDEKMRSQLIDFLNKMTADDPMDRPTYTQSLEFFSQLKKDFEIEKKLQEMPKKIALLDYEVFSDINSELDDENALEKLYLYLKGFDEVKLSIDSSKNITDLALINFKRTLEAQGIPLKEEVFERSNTSELLEQLKQSTLNKQDIYENITTDLILNQVLETNKTIKIDNTKSEMEDKKYEQKTHEKDQLSSKEEAQQLTYLIDNISTLWDALNLPEKNDF